MVIHMSFIEDFYYGNIEPQMRNIKQNLDFQKDFSRLCEIEAVLKEKLTGGEKKLFLERNYLWGLISSYIDLDSFKARRRYGARFMLDVLTQITK